MTADSAAHLSRPAHSARLDILHRVYGHEQFRGRQAAIIDAHGSRRRRPGP